MKRILSSILIATCLLSAPITFTGCGTTSHEAIIYYTFRDTQTLVHRGMDVFAENVVLGNVKPGKKAEVEAAYKTYQTAFKLALMATSGDLNQPVAANVQRLADELIKLIYSM